MYETPTQFLRLVHKGTNSPRASPAFLVLCQYVLVLFFLKQFWKEEEVNFLYRRDRLRGLVPQLTRAGKAQPAREMHEF